MLKNSIKHNFRLLNSCILPRDGCYGNYASEKIITLAKCVFGPMKYCDKTSKEYLKNNFLEILRPLEKAAHGLNAMIQSINKLFFLNRVFTTN